VPRVSKPRTYKFFNPSGTEEFRGADTPLPFSYACSRLQTFSANAPKRRSHGLVESEELTLTLDIGAAAAIYLRPVGTAAKVVLGLMIILSVTTILLTPDPNDDVMGILHQQHVMAVQPVLLSVVQVFIASTLVRISDELVEVPLSVDLLDLVCTRLC
jgi:hypothetical protein